MIYRRSFMSKSLLVHAVSLGVLLHVTSVFSVHAEEAKTLEDVNEESSKESTVTFSEETPVYTLPALTVTATKNEKSIGDVAADVTVVNRKQIENMNAQSVEEVLRTVSGVQFLSYGSSNIHANLNGIRINGSKDVVLMVDGVKMQDFSGAGSGGYMYASMMKNLDNIERVEVMRGAASTLYGSGAKGGVINIITRKDFKPKTTIGFSTGSYQTNEFNISTQGQLKGKLGKLNYMIYASKHDRESDVKDAKGLRWPGGEDQGQHGFSLNWQPDEKNTLSFSYNKNRMKFNNYDLWYNQDIRNGFYKTSDFTITYNHKFNKFWNNKMSYRRSVERSSADLVQKNGRESKFWNSNTKYQFFSEQLSYISPKYEMTAGLDYSKGESLDQRRISIPNPAPPPKNISYSYYPAMENFSWYFHNKWNITSKFSLEAGLRHDIPKSIGLDEHREYQANIDENTSKSFKASFQLTPKDLLYVGQSDYFILPSMTQLYNKNYGNRLLLPAKGKGREIGYKHKFNENSYFSLNLWDQEDSQSIGFADNGSWKNYKGGDAAGWNAEYSTQINKNFSAYLSWSHIMSFNDKKDNYSRGYRPQDVITLLLNYKYHKLDIGVDGRYFIRQSDFVQSRPWSGWPSNKYAVVNVSLNYSPNKDTKFYFKVNNVFNKLWGEHTQAIWGKEGQFYTMPGRNYTVGIEYSF